MIEPVLFITAGAALYGGVHHLYHGIPGRTGHLQIIHAVMFLLLAGFALSGTSAGLAHSLAEFSWFSKLPVSLGILLFATLPWFIVLLLQQRSRLLPALLTLAWSALLLINIASPYSLLYQDVSLVNTALSSGQPSVAFHATANPAWHLVEITMLSTLFYSMYLCAKQYHSAGKSLPIALITGLLLLLCTTLFDFFVYAGLVHSAYLAPMGFLLFLVAAALHRQSVAAVVDQQTPDDANRYQITLNFNQEPEQPPQARQRHADIPAETEVEVTEVAEVAQLAHQHVEAPVVPSICIDNTTVDRVSDGLVDIAVDATLMLKRLEQGDIDARELKELGRKVRTRAIETRRITHRILRSQQFRHEQKND